MCAIGWSRKKEKITKKIGGIHLNLLARLRKSRVRMYNAKMVKIQLQMDRNMKMKDYSKDKTLAR